MVWKNYKKNNINKISIKNAKNVIPICWSFSIDINGWLFLGPDVIWGVFPICGYGVSVASVPDFIFTIIGGAYVGEPVMPVGEPVIPVGEPVIPVGDPVIPVGDGGGGI